MPIGVKISILLCLWFFNRRTIIEWQVPHSTLIKPSLFLYPVTRPPQFGQYHENEDQSSLSSITPVSPPSIITVHLVGGAKTLRELMGSIYRDENLFLLRYVKDFDNLVAGFTFHPTVSFFQIEVSVDCAADRAADIICFQKEAPFTSEVTSNPLLL